MKLIANKNYPLHYFNLTYGSLMASYLLRNFFDATHYIRYAAVLIPTAMMAILFLLSHRSMINIAQKKLFTLLTILIVVQMISYVFSDSSMMISSGKSFYILSVVDSYLFIVITLLIGVSFAIKKPFFYQRTKITTYRISGIVLILFSILSAITLTWMITDIFSFIAYMNQ